MKPIVPLAVLLPALVAGCSSQQLYGVGQQWQRDNCDKLPDLAERNRCLASAATSYDAYQRQTGVARGEPPK